MPAASKVVILEENPAVVNIIALPTAVAGLVGIAERGTVGEAVLTTDWAEWVDEYGGFTATADMTLGAYGFYKGGGKLLWGVRTVHYTDITDATTATAVKASHTIQNAGTLATSAAVTSVGTQNFTLANGQTLLVSIDGAGATTVTFNATAGHQDTNVGAWPIADQDGLTLILTVDGGSAQTVTFAGVAGVYSAAEYAAQVNAGITGASADASTGQVVITSDTQGTGSAIAITGGTSAATWAAAVAGTGDCVNIAAITGTEIATVIDADLNPDTSTTVNGTGTLTIETVDTGSGATIQVTGGTANTALAFDTSLHTGVDAAPANTLKLEGKTEGTYANSIKGVVSAASSGRAAEFDLAIQVSGVTKEVFTSVTMLDTDVRYVETVVNADGVGSNLVTATDLDAGGTPLSDRPINGTHGFLTAGDDGLAALADTDYVGDSAGATGLYAMDVIDNLRIVAIPGKATATVYSGIKTYCTTYRERSCFGVLSTPTAAAVATTAAMVTFIETTTAMVNSSEEIAVTWPRIKVANPDTVAYGTGTYIYVDPAAWWAGTMARNDDTRIGGVYEAPAGIDFGVIEGCLGLEIEEVNRLPKRELLARVLVNPIRYHSRYGYYVDGHYTLKETGNWPSISESRGRIHIAETIKLNLEWVKHRRNTPALRARVERSIRAFMERERIDGAFASDIASEAYFVDVSDKLNPPAVAQAGKLKIKIGLNFGRPINEVEEIITKDTRTFVESLAA